MVSNILGFGGRLSRLRYCLCSVALGVALGLLALVSILALAPHFGGLGHGAPPPIGLILAVAAICAPPYLWFTLALMAKRVRDIGWPPAPVLLGWLGLTALDALLGHLLPALSLGHNSGTPIGGLVNLALTGCLMFWPSNETDIDTPAPPIRNPATPAKTTRPPKPEKPLTGAPAREAWALPRPVQTGFGRRGA